MPDQWRPVPPELDIPGSVYESRVSVTGAGVAPPQHPSWETAALSAAASYTYFADVSQFQGVPVDASYRYPVLSFRICDGTYFDTMCQRNWAAASRLLTDPSHPLELVWVYFGYRPGTWDSVAAYIHRVFGSDRFPDRVAAMIDVEPWGGQVSGNHSAELNQWAANLAGRTVTGQASVVGYSYSSGFAELWPQMAAWIKRHTASYGTWDPSPYGWQYYGGTGTGGLPGWPHGAGPWPVCDMNVIKSSTATVLADFGYSTEEEDMTDEQAKQLAELHRWFTADPAPGQLNLGSTLAAILPVVQTNQNKLNALAGAVSKVPTAAEVADAVLKAGGGGGLSEAQLIAVLNRTGLQVGS